MHNKTHSGDKKLIEAEIRLSTPCNRVTKKPDKLYTVFAGVDFEAVEKVREMCLPYPPSSPAIALFNNGELIHFVERHHIEGRNASMISDHLIDVFDEHCN